MNKFEFATILVVDDEERNVMLLETLLHAEGYATLSAGNGRDALAVAAAEKPDLILLDVMMPGMDGFETVARLKDDPRTRTVPVIMVTSLNDRESRLRALEAGAEEFLAKPINRADLTVRVRNLLRLKKYGDFLVNHNQILEEKVEERTAQLKKALAQLDTTREQLLKAARVKSEFMTTITHEMRTPMNGVIGALDLLEDSDFSGTQREFVLLARQAADNMVALVNQLLSFSGCSGSSPAVCHEVINPRDTLEALMNNYRPLFARKRIIIDTHIAPETPSAIRCDGERLAQLLDILLGNALKFTERGEVSLKVTMEQSHVRCADLHFCVKDSGIGIPADMLERIFEPFTQVDGSLARRFEGTGLGLSIARQVAQLIGGRVWAESILGEGCSFHFLMGVDLV